MEEPTDYNGYVIEPTKIEDIGRVIRIARRGRKFEVAAKEAGMDPQTLRRAERGEPVSLPTLQAISNWTNESFVITPKDWQQPVDQEPDDADS